MSVSIDLRMEGSLVAIISDAPIRDFADNLLKFTLYIYNQSDVYSHMHLVKCHLKLFWSYYCKIHRMIIRH